MRFVPDGAEILDLCTGSGCLLLALMHYKNGCRGVGVDISEDALSIARENLALIENEGGLNGGSAKFLSGDLYDALPGEDQTFDFIISNPPYIRTSEIETLAPEVRDHDPRIALDGGDDGLIFYRRIAKGAAAHLNRGGMIFLEIGYDQGDEVSQILADKGFRDVEVIRDYSDNDRVVKGTKNV
jgi:release factor glutamine methyltransferase